MLFPNEMYDHHIYGHKDGYFNLNTKEPSQSVFPRLV